MTCQIVFSLSFSCRYWLSSCMRKYTRLQLYYENTYNGKRQYQYTDGKVDCRKQKHIKLNVVFYSKLYLQTKFAWLCKPYFDKERLLLQSISSLQQGFSTIKSSKPFWNNIFASKIEFSILKLLYKWHGKTLLGNNKHYFFSFLCSNRLKEIRI